MRHVMILLAGLLAGAGRVLFPCVSATRWALIPLLAVLLTACAATSPEPPPPPAINIYQCATPAGMTAPEPQPKRPRGEYTQDDVALYITRLHQWGMQGWLKLASVREHADKCVASTEDDDEND